MIRSVRVPAVLPAVFIACIAGCASPKTPPPADPTREQIIILQKQLLELQSAQNETRKKMDEQAAIINSLSGRIKEAEDRRAALSSPTNSQQTANSHTTRSKRTVKSKGKKPKPVRRQEQ